MNDTISRQAAIDALNEHRGLYCDTTPDAFSKLSYPEKCRVDELDTAIATLVNLPPADAVEVVRCKDCKHRDPEDHKCDSGELERAGCIFKVCDEYFCAYGER